MKTDTDIERHPDTCAHKSRTYQEQCSQGHAWAKGRCTHWHKHVRADTGAQACRKIMETQRKKLLDTQKDYTGEHRDSRNRYIERGPHVQSQR